MGCSFRTRNNHSARDDANGSGKLMTVKSNFLEFSIYSKVLDGFINDIFSANGSGFLIVDTVQIDRCVIRSNILSLVNNIGFFS